MMIKLLLVIGLMLSLIYAFLQRHKSPPVAASLCLISLAGIYFVLLPEHAAYLAHLLGVGRGTDLVLYCWIVISLLVSANLQFKLLKLQESMTDLAREIAVRHPMVPTTDPGQPPASTSHLVSRG